MYLKSSTIYESIVPGAEYIRSLVRQWTISQDAAIKAFYNTVRTNDEEQVVLTREKK